MGTRDDGRRDARRQSVRAYLHRWVESSGAQLLVVDPSDDGGALAEAMAGRGVHVTWVGSTLDGLVEFGRTDPHAVVVTPGAPGIPAEEFVGVIRQHGSPYVIAATCDGEEAGAGAVGPLMLAGASAVAARPYAPQHLWDLLTHAPRSLAEHARLEFGPITLDATAYSVRVEGERIADLPLKEFELLRALLLAAPGVVTDDELRDALWGTDGKRPGGNTIAMHVTRLRARLGGAADVRRIRGRGYSLTAE
jgi:DNA-binding response OmpR family regulator